MGELGPEYPRTGWAAAVNLLIPGGGLIWVGATWSGLLVGLICAACANLALLSVLVLPEEFARTTQVLLIALAAGSYVGAQVRLAHAVRSARTTAAGVWRRRILWEVRTLVERGEYGSALAVLSPLVEQARDDLLVLYRHAQVLTHAGGAEAAQAACERLRRADRHGLYKEQVRLLAGRAAGSPSAANNARSTASPPH